MLIPPAVISPSADYTVLIFVILILSIIHILFIKNKRNGFIGNYDKSTLETYALSYIAHTWDRSHPL